MTQKNIRQTCLQTILTKRFLTGPEFSAVVQQFGLEPEEFKRTSNEMLEPIGLEIRDISSDYDEKRYLGVCQRGEDSNAKEGLSIPEPAIPVFFKFIDSVINKEDHQEQAISIGRFLDLCDDQPNLKVQEHIALLKDLGYIEVHDQRLRVGPRGLLEFRPVFSEYSGRLLEQCPICLDFVLAGMKCPECKFYCHKRCMSGILNKKCPQCAREVDFVEFGM
jgi:hypothetical protein